MAAVGRPRLLDETKRREICAMFAVGCEIRTAANYVGCSVQTIRREMLREPEFAAAMRRAAAWLLERTDPDRYGRKHPAMMKPEDAMKIIGNVVEVLLDSIPDEEAARNLSTKIDKLVRDANRELLAAAKPRKAPAAELAKSQESPSPAILAEFAGK